jgi:hypothetical protein
MRIVFYDLGEENEALATKDSILRILPYQVQRKVNLRSLPFWRALSLAS